MDQQTSHIHVWNIPSHSQSFLKRINVKSETILPDNSLKQHKGALGSFAFSPRGNLIVSVDRVQRIIIVDVEQEVTRYILCGHKERIREIVFSPSGKMLASMSDDGISISDIASQHEINFREMDETGRVLLFSPDGNTIVCGTYSGEIRLLDTDTLDRLSTHVGHTSWVNALVFLDNGQTLASASKDGTIILWEWEMIAQHNQRR